MQLSNTAIKSKFQNRITVNSIFLVSHDLRIANATGPGTGRLGPAVMQTVFRQSLFRQPLFRHRGWNEVQGWGGEGRVWWGPYNSVGIKTPFERSHYKYNCRNIRDRCSEAQVSSLEASKMSVL